jgi:hypothetical protein
MAASAVGYAYFIPNLDWRARLLALVFSTIVAAVGAVFLKRRQMAATGESLAAVAAALALLSWASAFTQAESSWSGPTWRGLSLFLLAAAVYGAGRIPTRRGAASWSPPRVWRVVGLLLAPWAALYVPDIAGEWSGGWSFRSGFGWLGLALIAALGRRVDSERVERTILEVFGGLGLLVAAGNSLANPDLKGDWFIWLLVAVAAVALGQDHKVAWAPVTGASLVFSAISFCTALDWLGSVDYYSDWPSEAQAVGTLGGLATWAMIALIAAFLPARVFAGQNTGRNSGPTSFPTASTLARWLGTLSAGALGAVLTLSLGFLIQASALAFTGAMVLVDSFEPFVAVSLAVPVLAVALTALVRPAPRLRLIGDWSVVPLGIACLAAWASVSPVPPELGFGILVTASLSLSAIAAGAVLSPRPRPRFSRALYLTARPAALALLMPATIMAASNSSLHAVGVFLVPAAVFAVGMSMRPAAWPFLSGAACLPFIILAVPCLDQYGESANPIHILTAWFCLLTAVLAWFRRPQLSSWAVLAGLATGLFAITAADLVFGDRSWTGFAGSLSMAILSLTVALAARRPLPRSVRVIAACLVVFSSALTLVVPLAFSMSGSASPTLFPVIAVVAAAAGAGGVWLRHLALRLPSALETGADAPSASESPSPALSRPKPEASSERNGDRNAIGTALIAAAAVMGFLTVILSIAWPFTHTATVLATAAILAAAAAGVASFRAGTEAAWWYAGAMGCVVLWSALVMGEVGLAEAYTLPPALAAATIGGCLMSRRPALVGLTVPAAWLAVVPPLVLLWTANDPLLRCLELTALGIMALTIAGAFDHLRRALAPVALAPAAGILTLALTVGQLHSSPFPIGFEVFLPLAGHTSLLFGTAVLIGLVAAAAVVGTAQLLARPDGEPRADSRAWSAWMLVALVVAAMTPVFSVDLGTQVEWKTEWPVVAAAWLAMAAVLALALLAARSQARGESTMPPFWAIWLVAVALGIAGWSPRGLRVEVFALPLGIALFAAGLIHSRWLRSIAWSLTPGVAATLGPSTLAVGTDPLTWRAIMVLVLAWAFMIIGALRRWQQPTLVAAGSMILALVLALARQGSISAIPWLTALLAVGGSLLAAAVFFELRSRLNSPGPPTPKSGTPGSGPGVPTSAQPVPAASQSPRDQSPESRA